MMERQHQPTNQHKFLGIQYGGTGVPSIASCPVEAQQSGPTQFTSIGARHLTV